MVKKASLKSKKHVQRTDTHWVVRRSLLSYAVLVFLLFAMLSMSIFLIDRLVANKANSDRYGKIMSVYQSLNLGDSYREQKSDVFGDKRIYESDKSRTYASSIIYSHLATPTETMAAVHKQVVAAGFTYVQTEYADSIQPIQEFKNSEGVWIRVGTMSKSVYDMLFVYNNATAEDPAINHKDEAPTYVTVKVNLDDNNE